VKLKDEVGVIPRTGAGIGEVVPILLSKKGAKVSCNSIFESTLKVTEKIINSIFKLSCCPTTIQT